MSTLNKNISQTIEDFDSIKEAIIEKGVDVSEGTPTSQYGQKIREIETGITPAGTLEINSNGEYDVTEYASADVEVPQLSGILDGSITTLDVPKDVDFLYRMKRWDGYFTHNVFEHLSVLNLPEYLGEDTKTIVDGAFSGTLLTNVYVPKGWIIDKFAFAECKYIEEINIQGRCVDYGGNVREVGCFENCGELNSNNGRIKKVIFGNNQDNYLVPKFCFFGTKISKLILLYKYISIDSYAFSESDVADVYFAGTETEWSNLTIEMGNEDLTNATIHFNYSDDGSEL